MKEIKGIMASRPWKKQGYQYSLGADHDGYYPNVRTGKPEFLYKGEVWKIGKTISSPRYSQAFLKAAGVYERKEVFGNQVTIKIAEKMKLYDYFRWNGTLPPGNYLFR